MGRNGYTGKFHLHMRKNWTQSCATCLSRVVGPSDQLWPIPTWPTLWFWGSNTIKFLLELHLGLWLINLVDLLNEFTTGLCILTNHRVAMNLIINNCLLKCTLLFLLNISWVLKIYRPFQLGKKNRLFDFIIVKDTGNKFWLCKCLWLEWQKIRNISIC